MEAKRNLDEFYSSTDAAKRLSKNSGRTISSSYLRRLVDYGVIHPIKIGAFSLYPKKEINAYIVHTRSDQIKRARKTRHKVYA